jgi:hypothetical protein
MKRSSGVVLKVVEMEYETFTGIHMCFDVNVEV